MATPVKLLAIAGQTASGKSDLAMRIAKEFRGEIICADSRTVYIGMDIATAKPSMQDQAEVRHWCIDMVKPSQRFTVYEFQQAAKAAIVDIHSRGKLPILVGGSGLYFDAVLYDFNFKDGVVGTDYSDLSSEELQVVARQQFGDSLTPDTLGNRRYLLRALQTGQEPHSIEERVLDQNVCYIGLQPHKDALEQRIRARVALMVDAGLIKEAVGVIKKGLTADSRTAIGYRAFELFVQGQEELEVALEKFVQGDLKLAKRQMTWFKRDPNIKWFNEPEDAYIWVSKQLS